MLTKYEKGFLEGIIDADGCIGIYKHPSKAKRGWHAKVTLSISNCNRNFLEKAQSIIGAGKIRRKVNMGYGEYGKLSSIFEYTLQQYGKNGCKKLFPQIKLVVKEERRIYAFKLWKHIEGSSKNQNRGEEYEKQLLYLMDNIPSASRKTI